MLEWEQFECANCGDVHNPDNTCYCGCHNWMKGDPVAREEEVPPDGQ